MTVSASATFWLRPVAPFRLDLTAWALRRRPHNVMDRWNGRVYGRALVVKGSAVEVAVAQVGSLDSPRLRVTLTGPRIETDAKATVRESLERLLGLRINLAPFYRRAAADPKLQALVSRFRGLKPPRFPTMFETLANALACQQMSLSVGMLLLNRLTEQCGLTVEGAGEIVYAFPRPEDVAPLRAATLRRLGFSRQKGSSLIALARACVGEQIDWDALNDPDDDAVVERLVRFQGIGRWSAEYALLRGLGRLNVCPGDDVGARNNLRRWLGLRRPLAYTDVRRLTARWQPYAGLVYFYMLLDRLDAAGRLAADRLPEQDAAEHVTHTPV
ncbi:MAG: DNA-3-methyladenine glycosylase 2 family protein [Candidatus Methylomirabilota bacterium]|nr:DNA-3-methyladenine glycosylase 2 family protein [candidate division NC10 bacterium]PWB46332.1 MAG: DNA-3-methyladenine glycosylase 2 family protein [candidate division NC10 bacterium]